MGTAACVKGGGIKIDDKGNWYVNPNTGRLKYRLGKNDKRGIPIWPFLTVSEIQNMFKDVQITAMKNKNIMGFNDMIKILQKKQKYTLVVTHREGIRNMVEEAVQKTLAGIGYCHTTSFKFNNKTNTVSYSLKNTIHCGVGPHDEKKKP